MTVTITDSTITSDRTTDRADLAENGQWVLSWMPTRRIHHRPAREAMVMADRRLSQLGPRQLADYLVLDEFQVRRLPSSAPWGRDAAAAIAADIDTILPTLGTVPDVGSVRATTVLTERLGIDVTGDAVTELGAQGHLPIVGDYKGHDVFCGRALETFDRPDLIGPAEETGRMLLIDDVAAELGVRRSDADHLVRAGLLTVHTATQTRWGTWIYRYRRGDVLALLDDSRIDWDTVRTTPRGRRSPLAALPTATTA
ncbi:hypothetical protein [Stackebrandtia soli]|uniref:hypothetical protein n=1 Tax=Stackebrandtia soli TaxID=1892856 RepID=UPI0039ED0C3B